MIILTNHQYHLNSNNNKMSNINNKSHKCNIKIHINNKIKIKNSKHHNFTLKNTNLKFRNLKPLSFIQMSLNSHNNKDCKLNSFILMSLNKAIKLQHKINTVFKSLYHIKHLHSIQMICKIHNNSLSNQDSKLHNYIKTIISNHNNLNKSLRHHHYTKMIFNNNKHSPKVTIKASLKILIIK